MPTYKHRDTEEEKYYGRVKILLKAGKVVSIDMETGEEIPEEWEVVREIKDYKSIAVAKAPKDGGGFRS